MDNERLEWLKATQVQHNDWTLQQLRNALEERFPEARVPSTSTLSRELVKMNFTRKSLRVIPVERNYEETIDAREDYGRWALEREDIMDRAIYVDESSFNVQLTEE